MEKFNYEIMQQYFVRRCLLLRNLVLYIKK